MDIVKAREEEANSIQFIQTQPAVIQTNHPQVTRRQRPDLIAVVKRNIIAKML